ncbi:MAG: sigma 54-interacting transcriptional regulator [Rectinema sp.]|uniref:Transcriptional regulator, NifA subfamily, Fis Family n=1 Tax=uncultured spirochete TaxID=156406 RepID=A0A3P3XTL4_9SPIR|nr:Transcriptional regulator, NifA subfamily, Fis Family [uncultured spirochete]
MISAIDSEKFRTLIDINARLNSSYTDFRSLLKTIVESAARLVGAEAASLALFDAPTNSLRFEIALGPRGAELQGKAIPSSDGIAGWVFHNSRSIIVNDAAHDARFSPAVSKEISYSTNSILAVPLKVRDKTEGVIELINKTSHSLFVGDDLEWVELFAVQASIAFDNAKQYERTEHELVYLQHKVQEEQGWHPLVFSSRVMQDRLDLVKRVAPSDASVLILGESGVGKELIAEQLHLNSRRNQKPFVRVNCAALPENLLESELFGHVKGAFTDAISNREGRFEAADGGTIFLDEIAELPLKLQSKLLRVIQQKTFERIGSNETIKADVRIVAATNRDIEKLVQNQEFRSDLYYRLNVLPIQVPPLRERLDDIPTLAEYFLTKYARETNRGILHFSDSAMECMLSYSWPGNIRELENAVERAVLIAGGTLITTDDLMIGTKSDAGNERFDGKELKEAIILFKSNYIRAALEQNRWNQTETARHLKIQRTYLSRLIKELNILQSKE